MLRLNRKTFDLGMYDSATGRTIKADKVVETRTKIGERMVLAYATAERGPLVQLGFPYDDKPRGPTIGMTVHFFLDELAPTRRPEDDTLDSMARRCRMQRDEMEASATTAEMRAASTTCVVQPDRERKRTNGKRTVTLENRRMG